MKHFALIFVFISIVFVNGYSQQTTNDWPSDVKGLVKHLNDWFPDELDLYERPEAYPNNRIPSGETNAWVMEHKRLLKNLGAEVVWDKDKKLYFLKKEY